MFCFIITSCKSTTSIRQSDEVDSQTSESETIDLLVYSGAGLKNAMEEIKTTYETDHNVNIEYVYAGSAQLISQIEMSGKGDVFIVGSDRAYTLAKEKGLANESQQVAHHTPCIGVQTGNPKGINRLEDLTQDGIKVILGDPEANAIGLSAKKIIEKAGLDTINDNVVSLASTVNEIVTQLSSGQADAAIITADSVHNNDKIEIIEIPEDQNVDQIIPVCTLTLSEKPEEAQAFVDFIASDQGKKTFKENGFEPVE